MKTLIVVLLILIVLALLILSGMGDICHADQVPTSSEYGNLFALYHSAAAGSCVSLNCVSLSCVSLSWVGLVWHSFSY